MNMIILTPAQVEAITTPAIQPYKARLSIEADRHSIVIKRLERKHERQLNASKTRIAEWKQRYRETRKHLLEARAEIVELKRTLRERY